MTDIKGRYVLIGGGRASGSAIDTLLDQGVPGSDILLVSGESAPPYNRPPLSKGFLAGHESEASIYIHPNAYYEERGVHLLFDTRVTELDAENFQLTTDVNERIRFDRLLIATGSRPRQLPFASGLENVLYLRTLPDSQAIQAATRNARRAVIVGAGFIGMEVAATLRTLGLEVTILHRGDRLLDRFAAPAIAQFFTDYFVKQGITFKFQRTLDHVETTDDRATHVVTDHDEHLPADLVVIGVGVELNLDFLKGTAIRVANGIVADEELETAVPGIFAAGDIVNFPDPIFGNKRRRIEHWDHAIATGEIAARNMLGGHEVFRHLSYFFSDMFDLSFELWGDTDEPEQVVFTGSADDGSAAAWYLRNQRVSAYFAINRPDQEKDQAQRAIIEGIPVSQLKLPMTEDDKDMKGRD